MALISKQFHYDFPEILAEDAITFHTVMTKIFYKCKNDSKAIISFLDSSLDKDRWGKISERNQVLSGIKKTKLDGKKFDMDMITNIDKDVLLETLKETPSLDSTYDYPNTLGTLMEEAEAVESK